MALLLAETYHPKAIVFGTEIRDYAPNTGTETAEEFLQNQWIAYRLGDFNLRGWLAEHSAAYRYYLANRNWMYWDYPENHSLIVQRTDMLTDDGYDIENRIDEDPHRPPDPSDEEDAKDLAFFANYALTQSRVDDLKDLLSLQEDYRMTVLIVEMPVVPELYQFFPQGEAAHEEFVETVSSVTDAAGSWYLPAISQDLIPEDGYSDRVHLSKFGAPVFSRYLGDWLADLHTQHGLDLGQEGTP